MVTVSNNQGTETCWGLRVEKHVMEWSLVG